jgi:hypothetical protein
MTYHYGTAFAALGLPACLRLATLMLVVTLNTYPHLRVERTAAAAIHTLLGRLQSTPDACAVLKTAQLVGGSHVAPVAIWPALLLAVALGTAALSDGLGHHRRFGPG